MPLLIAKTMVFNHRRDRSWSLAGLKPVAPSFPRSLRKGWESTHLIPTRGCQTIYSTSTMIRILETIFAGLLGLAFGSFLNVCLSRWPADESVVTPRSHCRHCGQTLTWWENLPLISWLALRGRCRTCQTRIGWRYPLVELAVGTLWAISIWRISAQFQVSDIANQLGIIPPHIGVIPLIGTYVLSLVTHRNRRPRF